MNIDLLATNSKRFTAYLIDVLPITLLVFWGAYLFTDFGETFQLYLNNRDDLGIREQFLKERNGVRNISFVIWVLYGTIMDASKFQGTLGKHLMGIKVSDYNGARITMVRSATRNFSKLLSLLPAFIGMAWILFDKQKRGWHDMIASTLVLKK